MFNAAYMAFGLCPVLTQGAIEALAPHGSPAQKALYLPKLVSGERTGTMNLTESVLSRAPELVAAVTLGGDVLAETGAEALGPI